MCGPNGNMLWKYMGDDRRDGMAIVDGGSGIPPPNPLEAEKLGLDGFNALVDLLGKHGIVDIFWMFAGDSLVMDSLFTWIGDECSFLFLLSARTISNRLSRLDILSSSTLTSLDFTKLSSFSLFTSWGEADFSAKSCMINCWVIFRVSFKKRNCC